MKGKTGDIFLQDNLMKLCIFFNLYIKYYSSFKYTFNIFLSGFPGTLERTVYCGNFLIYCGTKNLCLKICLLYISDISKID